MNFRSLIRGSALVFIGSVIGMGSSFILRFIVARTYPPNQYGTVILGITLVNFLSLLALLGLPQGFTRNTARFDEARDTEYVAFLLSVLFSSALSLMIILLPDSVFAWFGVDTGRKIISIFALSLPFLVSMRLIVGYFRGHQYVIGRVVSENIFSQGMTALIIIIIALFRFNYSAVAVAWLTCMFISSVVAISMVQYKFDLSFNMLSPNINFSNIKSLVVFSIPLMLTDATWKVMQQSDNFIISYFIGPTSVGYYDAAFTLSRILELAPATFGFLLLPMMTKLFKNEDFEEMRELYQFTAKLMAFMTVPILMVGVFLNEQLILYIFGDEYISAAPAVPIIMIGLFTHAVLGINKGGLVSVGKSKTVLRGTFLAAASNIILNIVFIPELGVYGAAVASAASYIILNVYFSVALYSATGIIPQSKKAVSILFLSVAVLSVLGGVFSMIDRLDMYIFVSIIAHIAIIYMTGSLDKSDIKVFRDMS